MKKVMIIGNSGSGKSTFSRQLSKKLDIPVIHLDKLFHQPNWTKPKPGEWEVIQKKLINNDSWVIDGTYHRTLPLRAESAEIIIYLKIPKWLSLLRILKRGLQYSNKQRPDLPIYLKDRLSWQLLYKALTFSEKRMFEKLKNNKQKVIVLKNNEEIKNYFHTI